MKYNHGTHHRRSIRLKNYDYAQSGAYFLTICTQHRQCLFGSIIDGTMVNNEAGNMIDVIWHDIPVYYPGMDIDVFQIMPNHIHGIIIVGAGPRACPDYNKEKGQPQGVAPTGRINLSLPDIIHRFKTITTKRYADGVKHNGWPQFAGRLWQRNYYEHVVRDDVDLNKTREYISNNPLRWTDDPDYMN